MVESIVKEMTKEQKQMVLDAKPDAIVCRVEKQRDKYYGVVNVYRAPSISGEVARTKAIYDDDMEALDIAEAVVDMIRGDVPEAELVDPEPTEKELDGMLKDAIEKDAKSNK